MTGIETRQILELRKKGRNITQIAEETKIARSTIKSFLKTYDEENDSTVCKECKTVLTQTHRGRYKDFCSERCRQKWWYKHRDMYYSEKSYLKTCLYCGSEFEVYYKKKQKYCCRDCYLNAIRRRKNDDG